MVNREDLTNAGDSLQAASNDETSMTKEKFDMSNFLSPNSQGIKEIRKKRRRRKLLPGVTETLCYTKAQGKKKEQEEMQCALGDPKRSDSHSINSQLSGSSLVPHTRKSSLCAETFAIRRRFTGSVSEIHKITSRCYDSVHRN
jgi:hypothetical protein